jgi:hypothetical protein
MSFYMMMALLHTREALSAVFIKGAFTQGT